MIPKISVIMPTRDRRRFIPQALKYFFWQDYSNKELIIVDDGDDLVADLIPNDPSIRYISLSTPLSIGMKRNIACSLATGEIIVIQDDDDYFGSHRLSQQIQPILRGEADCSACKMGLLLDLNEGCLYRCSDEAHTALFHYGVRSNTLLFKASYWHEGLYYEHSSAGEDTRYLLHLLEHGARLQQIVDTTAFISVRHSTNTSTPLDCTGWQQVPIEQYLSVDEQAFYRQFQAVGV